MSERVSWDIRGGKPDQDSYDRVMVWVVDVVGETLDNFKHVDYEFVFD